MSYISQRYALLNRWDSSHLRTVNRLLAPVPGDRLLEVGCGRGHLTRRLQEQGVEAIGVDANPYAITAGVARNLRVMPAETLDFPDGSFDLLCSIHTLEHIPAIEQALAEMARVVHPDGKLLFIYPAEPIRGLYALPTAIILYHMPFAAQRVHCHQLTPRRLQRLVAPLSLEHLGSEFHLLRSPQFASLFRKL